MSPSWLYSQARPFPGCPLLTACHMHRGDQSECGSYNKLVLLVWQMSAGGHIHKWTKIAYMCEKRQIVRLLWYARCVEAIACCCGPVLTLRIGRNFLRCPALRVAFAMRAGVTGKPSGSPVALSESAVGLLLANLYPWIVSGRRAPPRLSSLITVKYIKDEINTSENTAEPSTTSCCSGFGLSRMTLSNIMPCNQTLESVRYCKLICALWL